DIHGYTRIPTDQNGLRITDSSFEVTEILQETRKFKEQNGKKGSKMVVDSERSDDHANPDCAVSPNRDR
ncbi:MAG: hypothetical protein CUN57_02885, partial [Phototrophicales bacterium]